MCRIALCAYSTSEAARVWLLRIIIIIIIIIIVIV